MRSASRGGPFLKPKVSRVSASFPASLGAEHLLGDPSPQFGAGQVAGVDDDVGALAQRRQHLALGADAVDDPSFRGQRVATAGLLVAVEQRLLVGLEEEQPRLAARRASRSSSTCSRSSKYSPPRTSETIAGVLDPAALVAEQLAEAADHPRRQVVDAEVAAVLEGGDRFRLARPGMAGDDRPASSRGRGGSASCSDVGLASQFVEVARGSHERLCQAGRAPTRVPRGVAARKRSGEPKCCEQGALADGADAFQRVEHRAGHRPVAAAAVMLDREAVGLVADPLQELVGLASRGAGRSGRGGRGRRLPPGAWQG